MIENPNPDLIEDAQAPTQGPKNVVDEKREALARMFANVAPGTLRSRKAFIRNLPELLANPMYGRWSVAYCGEERIALLPSQRDVIGECLKRGLGSEEYFIGMVVPYDDEEYEIDQSLYEFDDVE